MDIEQTLRKQATEIAAAGHSGWARTMIDALEEIGRLTADLKESTHMLGQLALIHGNEMNKLKDECDALRTFAHPVAWILTSEQMPPSTGQTVLAYYKNENGLGRRVRAKWVKAKTVESNSDNDIGEYDEATDTYYDPEGWYEKIDNWPEYTSVFISHEVTHWTLLPEAPK